MASPDRSADGLPGVQPRESRESTPFEGIPTDELVAIVHDELVRIAARMRSTSGVAGPFDPSSMISKAYLRLCGDGGVRWNSRAHFLGAAARAMRRVVIDEARRRTARKRPNDRVRIALTDIIDLKRSGSTAVDVDVVRLDAALDELAEFRPRCAEVVNLRFFAGLSIDETAKSVGVDIRSVNRDWLFARTWLFDRLGRESDAGRP